MTAYKVQLFLGDEVCDEVWMYCKVMANLEKRSMMKNVDQKQVVAPLVVITPVKMPEA